MVVALVPLLDQLLLYATSFALVMKRLYQNCQVVSRLFLELVNSVLVIENLAIGRCSEEEIVGAAVEAAVSFSTGSSKMGTTTGVTAAARQAGLPWVALQELCKWGGCLWQSIYAAIVGWQTHMEGIVSDFSSWMSLAYLEKIRKE